MLSTKYSYSLFKSQAKTPAKRNYFTDPGTSGWTADRDIVADRLWDLSAYKLASKLRDCRKKVVVFKCPTEGHEVTARFPVTCKTVFCPECAKTAYYSLYFRYKKLMAGMKVDQPAPGTYRLLRKRSLDLNFKLLVYGHHRLQFLTLTKKHSGELFPAKSEVRSFLKEVKTFVNLVYPKKRSAGALAVLEFGKHKNMHAHLLLWGELYSRSQLSQLWFKVSRDSYILDRQDIARKSGIEDSSDALKYVLKYIRKVPFMESYTDTARYLMLITALRRIHTFGLFYNYKEKDQPAWRPFVCPVCQSALRFWEFDTENLWYDEGSYKKANGLDDS